MGYFLFLQATIGRKGSLKATRYLALSVVLVASFYVLFSLITAAWTTASWVPSEYYAYVYAVYGTIDLPLSAMPPLFMASFVLRWLFFVFWLALSCVAMAETYILFKRFKN